jgi:hypothetical protein
MKRSNRGSVKVAICAQARAEKKIVKKIFGARSAFDRSKAVFFWQCFLAAPVPARILFLRRLWYSLRSSHRSKKRMRGAQAAIARRRGAHWRTRICAPSH